MNQLEHARNIYNEVYSMLEAKLNPEEKARLCALLNRLVHSTIVDVEANFDNQLAALKTSAKKLYSTDPKDYQS